MLIIMARLLYIPMLATAGVSGVEMLTMTTALVVVVVVRRIMPSILRMRTKPRMIPG